MENIKLNEQIAFLRKQKNMTQEDLAKTLGVTNQAVSKWESSQCCPDIQLLPDIAKLFEVSIDELMGYRAADTSKDMILQLRTRIDELPKGEDFAYTLRIAYALHAIILSKGMTAPETGNPGWDTEETIKHAGRGEWGYSCMNLPDITTIMRMESVFYSSNKNLRLNNMRIREISAILKIFNHVNNLKVMNTLYELTVQDENAYTTINEIALKCELPNTEVKECIEQFLFGFISEKYQNNMAVYRIEGMYMQIIPLLSMFSNR